MFLCANPLLQVFFVETHGGDNAAWHPVDHDIGEQIIQAELPEEVIPRDHLIRTENWFASL